VRDSQRVSRSLASRSFVAIGLLLVLVVGCVTPISKGYEIHTADLTCEEANRQAYAAVLEMGMDVTSFRPAKPGSPGSISATRSGERGRLGGDVTIRCDDGEISIVSSQSGGFLGDKEFERGVFLGVAGRTGLEVVREGRYATGEMKRREPAPGAAAATGGASSPTPERAGAGSTTTPTAAPSGGLTVGMEMLRGFASILDFEADLGGGGVLPVKVVIVNGTRRAYDFEPSAIVMRPVGERTQVQPLSADAAHERLARAAGGGAQLGDVAAAGRLLREKALVGGRLSAGATRSGFVYFPLGDYERGRLLMIDVATGEAEGFAVDF
jgi:hypothetical protein